MFFFPFLFGYFCSSPLFDLSPGAMRDKVRGDLASSSFEVQRVKVFTFKFSNFQLIYI